MTRTLGLSLRDAGVRAASRDEPAEIVNVRHDLHRRGALDVGDDLLGQLLDSVPRATLDAVASHARSVRRRDGHANIGRWPQGHRLMILKDTRRGT